MFSTQFFKMTNIKSFKWKNSPKHQANCAMQQMVQERDFCPPISAAKKSELISRRHRNSYVNYQLVVTLSPS